MNEAQSPTSSWAQDQREINHREGNEVAFRNAASQTARKEGTADACEVELDPRVGPVGEGLGSVWPPDLVPEKCKEPGNQSCSQERLSPLQGRDDQPLSRPRTRCLLPWGPQSLFLDSWLLMKRMATIFPLDK